jgi:hypothetical protein
VSLFDRVPAGGSDLETNDLDRLGPSLHDLAFCSSEPSSHEAADHIAIEPMDAHNQCLGSAMRAAGEQPQQLYRAAGFRIGTAFLNGRHKSSIRRKLFTFY